MKTLLKLIAAAWLAVAAAAVQEETVQVRLQQGVIEGARSEAAGGRFFYTFRSIPFAKPPVGKLRFKVGAATPSANPVAAETWPGVRNGSLVAPNCPQVSLRTGVPTHKGSEDCLYLTVYTPRVSIFFFFFFCEGDLKKETCDAILIHIYLHAQYIFSICVLFVYGNGYPNHELSSVGDKALHFAFSSSVYSPALPFCSLYQNTYSAYHINSDRFYTLSDHMGMLNHNPHESALPVMVWLHGGGFTQGTSEDYPALPLLTKDVVLVTVQYRLGTLGFFSTEDSEALGNFGLRDQALALRWVQDNIRSLGGDPSKVTLFGESTGGASVHFHILSPLSEGDTKSSLFEMPTQMGFSFRKYLLTRFRLLSTDTC
ncbi:acylcarnitine hydrolase-like, partial [Penaeus japonicus]|uniref:acylcarnitine hydrolase-like n=1 Tax=Penaeus japonicus TaxID=27405 RepID=UPI001C711C59